MEHAAGLVTGHHIQIYRVDTAENAAPRYSGCRWRRRRSRILTSLPLGTAAAVVAHRAVFGEAARALDKFEVVILLPREDIPPRECKYSGRISSMPKKLVLCSLGSMACICEP